MANEITNHTDVRLNIATSKYCNNACNFCKADITKREHPDIEAVRELLEKNKQCKKVIFTTGEPTLNENLAKFIKLAKKYKYDDIRLITNGRKLADKEYLKELIQAGLTCFNISIHAHNSIVGDKISGIKGSYKETLKGLIYLNKLKEKYDFKLITSTTIIKSNLKYLLEILSLFLKLNIDEIILNPVIPQGKALENREEVLCSYSEIMEKYNQALTKLPKDEIKRIKIIGLPFCLSNYQNKNSWGKTEDMILKENNKQVIQNSNYNKMKNRICYDCIYYEMCDGIWKNYIKIFGWKEFNTVKI